MKKTLTICLLILLVIPTFAKRKPKEPVDPCSTVPVQKTAFGSSRGIEVGKWNSITNGVYQGTGLYENGGSYLATYVFYQFGQNITTLSAKSVVKVALQDGSIVEVISRGDCAPTPHYNPSGVWTEWHMEAVLNPEMLHTFAASPIIAIQTVIDGKEVTVSLSKRDIAKLSSTAQCFAQTIEANQPKGGYASGLDAVLEGAANTVE